MHTPLTNLPGKRTARGMFSTAVRPGNPLAAVTTPLFDVRATACRAAWTKARSFELRAATIVGHEGVCLAAALASFRSASARRLADGRTERLRV